MNRRNFFGVVAGTLLGGASALLIKQKENSLIEKLRAAMKNTKFKPPVNGRRQMYIILDEFSDSSGPMIDWVRYYKKGQKHE